MLVYNVIQYNKSVPESQKINLKGILVGNCVADWDMIPNPQLLILHLPIIYIVMKLEWIIINII